ncbi:WD40/YVTN/BNR-like repeat-containing protein [Evansella clarkii]|uniref:WD40/YVTN/BNR-like repeat-containing protein n=1 Tax=Evansella clarkii TaxID=79879 RepID=UPI000B452A28|nr:hypothetical protein [Evansella clarkii]
MKFFVAASENIFIIEQTIEGWKLNKAVLPDKEIQAVAADPEKNVIYAGTFDHGLLKSTDKGGSWEQAGKEILPNRVMSLHISPHKDRDTGFHLVYAGTEPSGLYCSSDGGKIWRNFPALLELPSKEDWSFPPRPETHHVKDIAVGYEDDHFILAGIELGGVMRSINGGTAFEDRKPGSQFDCHKIILHPEAHERIYETGGGGFAESGDHGKTWETQNKGLGNFSYLVHGAVDPDDPETIVVSGAEGPSKAYAPENAETVVFRRDSKFNAWERVTDGLPAPHGSTVFHLLSNPEEPGAFYAVNNTGIYRSVTKGKSWNRLPVEWPVELKGERIEDVFLLPVKNTDNPY